mmetsp:Transcript_14624/g.29268  ORF Transcript_14624/g.29268 Transcript_14624/m.29268 type:complete len:118 (-) Transcript_14624:306-659(-)
MPTLSRLTRAVKQHGPMAVEQHGPMAAKLDTASHLIQSSSSSTVSYPSPPSPRSQRHRMHILSLLSPRQLRVLHDRAITEKKRLVDDVVCQIRYVPGSQPKERNEEEKKMVQKRLFL